ncbi:MAG: flagellar brake protein [Desulfovibrio sp.]|nr:flagellar brake protein [Desulfovibrio sp.]
MNVNTSQAAVRESALEAALPLSPPTPKLHHDALPKLELAPNSRVAVNFNPLGSGGTPVQGEFLGTTHYEFLIIRLPSIPGLRNKLLPHMRVEISYVADGARNQFAAEIISFTQKPAFLLFTSYPDRMSVMETRNHNRVTCALPASFVSPYGDGVGIMSDLSKGGCRVVLEMTGQSGLRKLKAGDRLVLQTAFTWDKPAVKGVGIVRNVETAGARMTLGLAFGETVGEFVDELTRYLSLISVLN